MNPRRLEVEAYRDSLLKISGALDPKLYGLSQDLDADTNNRRTIYGRIGRGRLSNLLKIYDFPDPTQTSPSRDLTTTPLQQLFVLNGPFLRAQATNIAKALDSEPDTNARIRALYRKVLARDPSPKETEIAKSYLAQSDLPNLAHVLLSTNEVMFQK